MSAYRANRLSRCHIVWNHSPPVASFGNKLDYLGIVILMWGASIPTVYYGFSCDPSLRLIYWTTVGTPEVHDARLCHVLTKIYFR